MFRHGAGLLGASLAVGIPLSPPDGALDDGYYQLRDGRRLVFHGREEMERLRPEDPEEIERFVLEMRNEIGAYGIAVLGAIPVAMLGWTSWKERRRLLELLRPDVRSVAAGLLGGAAMLGINWLMSRWISSEPATISLIKAMPPFLTGALAAGIVAHAINNAAALISIYSSLGY